MTDTPMPPGWEIVSHMTDYELAEVQSAFNRPGGDIHVARSALSRVLGLVGPRLSAARKENEAAMAKRYREG